MECDKSSIRSFNQAMYFQRVLKSTLSPFGDKGCYESNNENKPWNQY